MFFQVFELLLSTFGSISCVPALWIPVYQNMVQWWAVLNTVMNRRVDQLTDVVFQGVRCVGLGLLNAEQLIRCAVCLCAPPQVM